MIGHYDREGRPLELLEWAQRFEDREYKQIGNDIIGGYEVSTVWSGMALPTAGLGEPESPVPLIFETMVFAVPRGGKRWTVGRWATERVACEQHALTCMHVVSCLAQGYGFDGGVFTVWDWLQDLLS